jgi:hypothetical protein
LTNPWSEMIDIETRQTSLNLAQSQIDNARVRILLSTKDFGVHNWLDASGYRSGVVTWRASTPDQPATPKVTVIRADQIDESSTRRSASVTRTAQLPRWRGFATSQNGTPRESRKCAAPWGKLCGGERCPIIQGRVNSAVSCVRCQLRSTGCRSTRRGSKLKHPLAPLGCARCHPFVCASRKQ